MGGVTRTSCEYLRQRSRSWGQGAEVFQPPAKATSSMHREGASISTARATVFNTNKPKLRAKANFILDTGSQQSYITTGFKDKLGLQTLNKQAVSIVTFGSQQETTQKCELVKLGVQVNEGSDMKVNLLTIPLICEPLARPNT